MARADASGSPKEAKDTLRSRQVARVIDLISEGPIKGLVGGERGVFIDGVALENKDGTTNFDNCFIQQKLGYSNQTIMSGFPSTQQEVAVNAELTYNDPIVRAIDNPAVDRVRVTVSVPVLQQTYPKSGDTVGAKVSFRIEVNSNLGGFKSIGTFTIDGKTSSKYQRSVTFPFSSKGPWQIRCIRTTADSTSQLLQNELFWDSYTEITDDKINYAHSSLVGIQIDSEQFASIPVRTYLVDGILCRIPSNYDPVAHTYSGTWNGKFKLDWTDNPAWVFYDLLVNSRYGLGQYLATTNIDKWALYTIGVYCDGLVPSGHTVNGKMVMERRYSCNIQITSQSEAFDLLQQMASIFHGWTYWSGNTLRIGADMPADPSAQFTNGNVIDGIFTYSGNDLRSRHTMAAVSWSDPLRLGDTRIAMVEDTAGISRYGIQRVDIDGTGITVEGQAQRTGSWVMYAEQYEAEAVTFRTSFEGNLSPGAIIRVMDASIAGKRRGGRIREGSTVSRVNFDGDPGTFTSGTTRWVSCVNTAGTLQMLRATAIVGGTDPHADMASPFAAPPLTDSVFVITEDKALEPTLWRTTEVSQVEAHLYEIIASRHLPSKYDYIERAKPLVIPDISDVSLFPPAVTNLRVIEYLVALSPISIGVRGTVSWTSRAPSFDLSYRSATGNWTKLRTDNQAHDFAATDGDYEFHVTPVGLTGMKGATASLNYRFVGKAAPPATPSQFKINVKNGIASFSWLPSTEIDVIIGGHFELKHTTASIINSASWQGNSTFVRPMIPGSSASVSGVTYQPGAWMLKAFDIDGTPSASFAVIKGVTDDSGYFAWERKCDQPTFPGTHLNTVRKMPQEWLTIATTDGGKWDSQNWDKIDDWPPVDELPTIEGAEPGINVGVYTFSAASTLDAGGVFGVRLYAEILAFPYPVPDDFLDSRIPKCDTWADWDAADESLEGQVLLMMRTTDEDPASGGADWTDWEPFIAGEHIARGFQFQAILTAPYGENIGIETLCVVADFRAKYEEGADIVYSATPKTVPLVLKYYHPPAIVVQVQDGIGAGNQATVDDRVILKKNFTGTPSRVTSFTVTITKLGAPVTRTFDYHASGY